MKLQRLSDRPFSRQTDLTDTIEKQMYSGLENYNRSGYEGVTETWDWVQADLGCCGVANSTDWDGVGLPIPASCCPASTANTTTGELVNPA